MSFYRNSYFLVVAVKLVILLFVLRVWNEISDVPMNFKIARMYQANKGSENKNKEYYQTVGTNGTNKVRKPLKIYMTVSVTVHPNSWWNFYWIFQ